MAKAFADKAAAINPGHPTLMEAYAAVGIDYDPSKYENIFADDSEDFEILPEPEEEPADDKTPEFVTTNPNPFNPITTISYSIKTPSHVKLYIYSITGQKVATLVDGTMTAGTHSVQFDGSNLASGMYFYRFTSPGFEKQGKMLLVK